MNYVLYHGGCYDGFGAAWAAYQTLKDGPEYIPVKWGQPIPNDVRNTTDSVYILDFAYPPTTLKTFKAKEIILLDHHKSAMEDYKGVVFPEHINIFFDMNRSGAGLAWDFFQTAKPRPALINYMEDRDLWRFKLPYTKEIFAWMQSWPMSFYRWDVCAQQLDVQFERVIEQATSIQRFKDEEIKKMVRETHRVSVGGRLVPTVNASNFFSDVADALLKKYQEAPFVAYYFDRADGTRQWGLRSEDSREDVATIAKTLGGGGHRNAAGFITEAPFVIFTESPV